MAAINVGGRELELLPGDSAERMARVAEYVNRTLGDADVLSGARGQTDDEAGRALYAALRLADGLFMAQDENTRLRRDMLGMRQRQFELESRCDALNRENCMLRARLENEDEG
jgi:hypothetical protein